ncbi:MAG: hypothetical protein QOF61_2332 [Acidobacteriota bacterium]|nr:hypothetical protein [Acidobacteriota bacterium]
MDDDNKDVQEIGATTEQHPRVELGPTEKLEDNNLSAPLVPGAQSSASEEIKKEVNLNTE